MKLKIMLNLGLLAYLSGCSYISNTAMYVSGDDIKVNPITRTVSGKAINFKIERQTDAQFLFPNKPKNFSVDEPEQKFWKEISKQNTP